MISKVTAVQGAGTWESKYGLMYSFEYTFEDGVSLKANHKTEDGAFKIGDEVEYEITKVTEYGNNGKVSKPKEQPFSNNKSFDPKQSLYQSCLNGVMAHYTEKYDPQYDDPFTAKGINDLAMEICKEALSNIEKL